MEKQKTYYSKLEHEKFYEPAINKTKADGEFQEFVSFIQLRLINEKLDLNKDYDIKDLDKQKLKIQRVIEELEKLIIEIPVEEVKQSEKKSWNESFQILLKAFTSVENEKKNVVKMSLRNMIISEINKK